MLSLLRKRSMLFAVERRWRTLPAWLGCGVLGMLLSACNTTPTGGVQVVDRNASGQNVSDSRQPITTGQYVVQHGDTLYSIAFRFGWDWQALAQRNHIAAPYVIRVGQAIRFDGRASQAAMVGNARPTATAPVVTSKPPAQVVKTTKSAPVVASKPMPKPAVSPAAKNFNGRWAWPAQGAIIGQFSSNGSLNKGIDIAGDLGEPVFSASDGSVVYAGSGLRGYGELVIIKHSDTYVSAYGHNRRLLVREGQQVKVGQVIAEMGSTGTDRVKLHFEIRRQGKPVNPLQYLPKR
jgi:lipoprotein NlpD